MSNTRNNRGQAQAKAIAASDVMPGVVMVALLTAIAAGVSVALGLFW